MHERVKRVVVASPLFRALSFRPSLLPPSRRRRLTPADKVRETKRRKRLAAEKEKEKKPSPLSPSLPHLGLVKIAGEVMGDRRGRAHPLRGWEGGAQGLQGG
jgi:hypothetical protein